MPNGQQNKGASVFALTEAQIRAYNPYLAEELEAGRELSADDWLGYLGWEA